MEEGRVRIVICCALALLLIVIGGVGYGVAQIAPPEDDSECLQSWDDLLEEYLEFRESSYLLVAPTYDVTPKAIRSWQNGEEDPQLDPYWFWHFEGGIRYFNRASKLGVDDFSRILIYEDVLQGLIIIMSCSDPDSAKADYREEIVYTAPLPEKKSADKTWARHLYEEFARRRIVFSVTMRNYRRAKSEYVKEQESADTELVSRAMATRSSGSYTGVWISIERPGQGVEVTVHVPEDYTNAVEVYTFEAQTTNRFEGMDSIWAMGTNGLIPGTNHTVTWTIPNYDALTNQFIAAGLQAVDDDSDGISDGKELFVVKSNPGLSDSDFDGIDDGWEVLYGLNACQYSSGEDADQDGFSNLEEYTADCDPTDPNDTPFDAVYVSASAVSGDGSWSNPVPTIAEGISLADTGQVVVLLPGVYRGAGNLGLNIANRSLSLRGCDFNGQTTILDGQHHYRGFGFDGNGTEEVELYNIDFTRISDEAIESDDMSLITIENCSFRDSIGAGFWGYIVLENDALMTGCIIENISIWYWTSIIFNFNANIEIRNSLFRNNLLLDNKDNSYALAELIEDCGTTSIDHCNFISNSIPLSYIYISNSIVWGNSNLERLYAHNCCLQEDTPGNSLEDNNIFGDPLLARDGISLRPESICIDAAAYSTNTDFSGEARWDYPYQTNRIGTTDIGMDEYVDQNLIGLPDYWASVNGLSPTASPYGDVDADGINNIGEYIGGTHPAREDTDNDEITDYDESLYSTDPLNPDSDEDNCPDNWELQFGLDPLDYRDGVMDLDGDSFNSVYEAYCGTSPNSSNSVPVVSNYYVDLYATSNGIGTAESPFNSVQVAVDHAEEYSIIWLNDGKYGGINGKFSTRGKAMIISSINGAGSCVLDGRNVLNGVDVNMGEENTVVLRGLTIRGADDYAINADRTCPVIERCLIEKVTGSGSSSSPILYNGGSPLILNCTIANNNTPEANYGDYIPLRKAMFINTVLANNTGIEDLINTNRAVLENCCLDFAYPGAGNIVDADPVESSVLQCHLRQDASCIDGGQDLAVAQDQDGETPWDHPSYAGPSIIDIGVDEYRDSDEDGLPDWWETQNGFNPDSNADASQDTDGDGLNNLAEYQQALNPNLKDNPADSDGDGMPDWWENDSGLNASVNDADSDNDGDGADNIVEWQFGTSPTNAADAVVIVNGVRARVVENWNVFRTDPLVFTNTPGSPKDIADIYQKIVTLSGYQNITGD